MATISKSERETLARLPKVNFVEVVRQLDATTVRVRADYNEHSDAWTCRALLNGREYDTRETTDIWLEIPDMLDCAIQEAYNNA